MGAMPASLFEDNAQRPGPWGPGPQPEPEDRRPSREPVFTNGVWYVLALVAGVLGGYALQGLAPPEAVYAWAFAPADLTQGRWATAATAVFLHGSWTHALMNAGFLLAFGTPVARFLGLGARGALVFLAFYLVSGVLANLAFAGVHWGAQAQVVGASGAVSALMGAAARIIGGSGRLGPVFSRFVLTLGATWLAVNVLIAVLMAFFGGGILPGAGGAGVAWEAHIAGFLFGVLLIGPFARLAPR